MADPITQVVQSLGLVTAYGYAKSKGYTGTEEEFAEAAAAIGQGAATATAAAEAASEDAETATTAAGTATTKAAAAASSATEAGEYKDIAENAAADAVTSKNAAAGSATSAAASAQAAATSEYNAGVAAGASSDYALVSQDHSEDSEAWAVGTKNGNPVPSTADQYNNNAKYYAEEVANPAATAAAASAVLAQEWATGQYDPTAEPGPENNAAYYAAQAADSTSRKMDIPRIDDTPSWGTQGQLLMTNGANAAAWTDAGTPSDAQVGEAVGEWLVAHPEATTTVQDGSLTEAKFTDELKLKTIKDYVTPEMFGAKGDGVTDDTTAIHAMCTNNNGMPMLFNGTYLVKGDNVFSYLENENEKTDFILRGNNSEILWESGGSGNSLFKFNWKVNKITINELTIKCKNNGGYIFDYYGNTQADVKAGAVSSHIYDIRVSYYQLGNVFYPDYVFYIHGYGHCDKMLVEKCEFGYFANFYYCENGEAVNNTFLDCSFFTNASEAVYFDFLEIYDNFNVTQCSFSLYTGQTLLKNQYGANPNNFYFNFTRNRYEMYGSGLDFNLIDAQFGVITFKDENFSISGFSGKELKISTGQNATFDITNCYFRKLSISIDQIVNPIVAVGKAYSYFKECSFVSNPDLSYTGNVTKKVIFINCNFPSAKNISYNAYMESRYSVTYSSNLFVHSFNSLYNYAFPPFYYAEKVKVRRTTQGSTSTNYTVTINGTDYTVTVGADRGSEAEIPFVGDITSISTDKNFLFNIIVETSARKIA